MTEMKNSAYRSMVLGKQNKTKSTPEKKKQLKTWGDEKWLNLNALLIGLELPCGKKYKGQTTATVCRPKFDKSSKTHKTPEPLAYNLTKKQIKKAIQIKEKGKRIKWAGL
jgi:hypothetical protein